MNDPEVERVAKLLWDSLHRYLEWVSGHPSEKERYLIMARAVIADRIAQANDAERLAASAPAPVEPGIVWEPNGDGGLVSTCGHYRIRSMGGFLKPETFGASYNGIPQVGVAYLSLRDCKDWCERHAAKTVS
jgi:hypothetical protein